MKILEELLKGEKVEWKKLGEVIKRHSEKAKHYPMIKLVYTVSKDFGIIPSLDYWKQTASKQRYSYQMYSEDTDNYNVIKKNMFAYNPARLNIGSIGCLFDKDIGLLSPMYVIFKINEEILNPRYVLYFLKSSKVLNTIDSMKELGARFRFDFNNWNKIEIPIPPLSVQKKIAEVLDKFENCATELQAELQERKKQYSYYRDKLLSEDYLNGIINKLYLEENQPLRNVTLGEIGEFTRGNGLQKKDFVEKGKPVIHYGQIYTKYGFETDKTISFTSEEVFKGLRKAQRGDLIITDTSENMEDVCKVLVWNGDEEIGISGHSCMFRTNENSKYIAYLFQTNFLKKQIEKRATGTKVISISKGDMEKFNIPLPPLAIQEQVVNVLDKFREYISETNGLLPKEIEQRQKQYVYFREKLLTFDTECSKNRTEPNRTELNS